MILWPIPFIDEWLKDLTRKEVDTEKYMPFNGIATCENRIMTAKDGSTYFNNFSGFNPAILTDFTIDGMTKEESMHDWIDVFLDVVKENCNGGGNLRYMEACFNFFIMCIAHIVQFPSRPFPFMPIFVGPQGTGKNFMLEVFALVIGSWNYFSTGDLEDVYGKHAELTVGKLLVNMDEIDAHSTKPYQSRIKKDVDNQTKKHVNRKFERPRTEKTYGRIVGTSNKPNPLAVDSDSGDRRYLYFVPSRKYKVKCGQWWDYLWQKMSNPKAIAALYRYLKKKDLSNYDFKTERVHALTPRYLAWIGQNQSSDSKVLAMFCQELQDNGIIRLAEIPKKFHEPRAKSLDDGSYSIDVTVTVTKTCFHGYYQRKMSEQGQHPKQLQNFNHAIINMGLTSMVSKAKTNGYSAWQFNPHKLLEELRKKGVVQAMPEETEVSLSGFKEVVDHYSVDSTWKNPALHVAVAWKNPALHVAVEKNDLANAEIMMKGTAEDWKSVGVPTGGLYERDENGRSILHRAISGETSSLDDPKVIDLIVQHTNLNQKIQKCCRTDKFKPCKPKRADALCKECRKLTDALCIECQKLSEPCKKCPELTEPFIDATDRFGETALYRAYKHRKPDILEALLKNGANRDIEVNGESLSKLADADWKKLLDGEKADSSTLRLLQCVQALRREK
jgi:hypothetical protein